MLEGRVKPQEAKKYWQEVLELFPDSDTAWDFCTSAGQKSGRMLTEPMRQMESMLARVLTCSPPILGLTFRSARNDLLSVFG